MEGGAGGGPRGLEVWVAGGMDSKTRRLEKRTARNRMRWELCKNTHSAKLLSLGRGRCEWGAGIRGNTRVAECNARGARRGARDHEGQHCAWPLPQVGGAGPGPRPAGRRSREKGVAWAGAAAGQP